MDLDKLWNDFLNKIEQNLVPMLYETWFMDTKLVKIDKDLATILVPMHVHKKHLRENYNDLIEETLAEITGTNYKFEYVIQEEIEDISKTIVEDQKEIAKFDSNLDSRYTFDNFIVGKSNKFARATALAVAEKPGMMYNPLFLYSKSGLGKTHLMQAIGNYIVENSNLKVLYVTSEKFVNDFLKICKRNNDNNFEVIDNFKDKYRNIDVLMIDDIQYLEIANTTQQEFFNTFNELHQNNKQIIISSDRSVDDLKKLEDRLRTRFNWGLTVDILPPDFELRMEIINKKLEEHNVEFSNDVKELIASNCTSDIRKLEGAITRVLAYATIMNKEINLDLATEALKDHFVKSIQAKNEVDKVMSVVANHYNILVEDLKSKKRVASIAVPRQIAMYICRNVLEESLPKIGLEFGGKDHTTVMHSVDKIKKEMQKDPLFKVEVEKLINEVKK